MPQARPNSTPAANPNTDSGTRKEAANHEQGDEREASPGTESGDPGLECLNVQIRLLTNESHGGDEQDHENGERHDRAQLASQQAPPAIRMQRDFSALGHALSPSMLR